MRRPPSSAAPPSDDERVTVWLLSVGCDPRPVTVRGNWRTFWTSEVYTQAMKDGAKDGELSQCYGIYRNKPRK